MSKLDQPLKVKHGLAAVAAALTLGVAGTAIPMATAGGGGGGKFHYREETRRVRPEGNEQVRAKADCRRGERVVGGGVFSTAHFNGAAGMMINSSTPFDDGDPNAADDDGWLGKVDAFANAGGALMEVVAICKE